MAPWHCVGSLPGVGSLNWHPDFLPLFNPIDRCAGSLGSSVWSIAFLEVWKGFSHTPKLANSFVGFFYLASRMSGLAGGYRAVVTTCSGFPEPEQSRFICIICGPEPQPGELLRHWSLPLVWNKGSDSLCLLQLGVPHLNTIPHTSLRHVS